MISPEGLDDKYQEGEGETWNDTHPGHRPSSATMSRTALSMPTSAARATML